MTTLRTTDGDMELYVAGDADTAKAAVIVIQEAFGVTTHIQSCADRIAAEGYLAVAPSLFHRTGSPVMAYDDFATVMPHMEALTRDGITEDLRAVTAHLEALGFAAAQRGIVGFCMGGLVAFAEATTGDVAAAVTFYGGGVAAGRFGYPPLIELAPQLKCAWLGCYGDLDKGIPVADVEQLRAAVGAVPSTTEIIRYETADHGFNCEDRPAVYNPDAAADAWGHMLGFFTEHLAARP